MTPYFADAWAYGGIPRLAHALTRGLVRRGHQVTVCTTDACDAGARLGSAPVTTTPDGVVVRVFPNVSNRLAYRLQFFVPRGLNRYMRRHARDFDVAHLHACHNLPGVVAARHLRRAAVPYVLAPNGTAPRIERRQIAKAIFDAAAGARVIADADRILAVSATETRQLQRLGIDESRIRQVPNPIDLDEFVPPVVRGRFRRRIGVDDDPLVLYLGTLTPRKRVDALVRAFAALTVPSRLVIAGNDLGAGAAVRRLVASLDLQLRTTFTGLLRGRERLEALADAAVVVYASEQEIFGLVPLESLLTGTPVIVGGDSGCAEVAGAAGGSMVVPPGDVPALTSAITTVLRDVRHWRARACDAAGTVRSLYNEQLIANRIESLYREIVTARA